MNQNIQICYKPDWTSDPNFWEFWFVLNGKYHREKAPSDVRNSGYWSWWHSNMSRKSGTNFDWDKG